MRWKENRPPRVFQTGRGQAINIADCGRLQLEADEQITFTTDAGGEWDVARKAWGFYATPSLNARLLDFGLRAALVRSFVGKYYLMIVERGKEPAFLQYLESEDNCLVRWLDNDADLGGIQPSAGRALEGPPLACPCAGNRLTSIHMYFTRPRGEVALPAGGDHYRRELFRCSLCGHFISVHRMGTQEGLYQSQYVTATYGDADGLLRAYQRILALPPEVSDNAGRVRRIQEFTSKRLREATRPTVLDVGSGLCVFLARMKQAGWACTALDPDLRAATHARDTVGVEAVNADWLIWDGGLGPFDLITFNKVLEHVPDPVVMLAKSVEHLGPDGVVYVEVPDGEAAAPPHGEGFGREEFFIEHLHVFSLASLARLAERAGLRAVTIERLREPSSKYTLRAFLTRR